MVSSLIYYFILIKMDIVDNNFRDRLDLMLKSVETADFIALDTEFSGLAVGFEDQVHAFD